jgi:AcrR family transcriptional regulator
MDIQIVDAIEVGRNLEIRRTFDTTHVDVHRMPREILAIRAAEYNLEVDDPFALDLLLLERFIDVNPEETPPLYSRSTIAEAVEEMKNRIEVVRATHGSPAEPRRLLAHGIDAGIATDGLVEAQRLLLKHVHEDIIEPTKFFRNEIRAHVRRQKSRLPLPAELQGAMLLAKQEMEEVVPYA